MSDSRDRRQHSRWLCSSLIDLTVVAGPRRGATHTGVVEDISVGGIGIVMDGAMAEGETVLLGSSSDEPLYAAVRYCSAGEAGSFRIGLEFNPGYCWSSSANWPHHRLDVPADEHNKVTAP